MHFYETKIECPKDGVVQLTEWLRQCVRESGVQSGIAVLSAPHTTSGISFNPVSYTHLDVYKRQALIGAKSVYWASTLESCSPLWELAASSCEWGRRARGSPASNRLGSGFWSRC